MAATGSDPIFVPDPRNEGWLHRPAVKSDDFSDIFGEIRVRVEAPDRARIRVDVTRQHRNILGTAHGGFLLAFIDQVYFVAPESLGIAGAYGGLTIDSATQFLGSVAIGQPVDAVVEVLRETGRMIFLRGVIEQGGVRAVAFSGTIRKNNAR